MSIAETMPAMTPVAAPVETVAHVDERFCGFARAVMLRAMFHGSIR